MSNIYPRPFAFDFEKGQLTFTKISSAFLQVFKAQISGSEQKDDFLAADPLITTIIVNCPVPEDCQESFADFLYNYISPNSIIFIDPDDKTLELARLIAGSNSHLDSLLNNTLAKHNAYFDNGSFSIADETILGHGLRPAAITAYVQSILPRQRSNISSVYCDCENGDNLHYTPANSVMLYLNTLEEAPASNQIKEYTPWVYKFLLNHLDPEIGKLDVLDKYTTYLTYTLRRWYLYQQIHTPLQSKISLIQTYLEVCDMHLLKLVVDRQENEAEFVPGVNRVLDVLQLKVTTPLQYITCTAKESFLLHAQMMIVQAACYLKLHKYGPRDDQTYLPTAINRLKEIATKLHKKTDNHAIKLMDLLRQRSLTCPVIIEAIQLVSVTNNAFLAEDGIKIAEMICPTLRAVNAKLPNDMHA